MNRLALFDCDGTLVDSQATICDAMEAAFASHDLPPPGRGDIRRVVGLSLSHAIRQLLPDGTDETVNGMVEAYKTAFHQARAAGRVHERLYPGLADLLGRLDEAEWLLGVATGKSDRGLKHCLETHGLAGRFVTLQTADRHPSKPHPAMAVLAMEEAGAAPGTTAMIGDTGYDMQLAQNAGCRAIGVDWGYHDAHELLAAGAQCVVSSMDELFEALHE